MQSTTASCARSRPAVSSKRCMGGRRAGGSRLVIVLLVLLVALLGLAPDSRQVGVGFSLGLASASRQEAVGFSLGVACGEMDADSVVLWTRPDRPTTIVAEIDDRPDFTTARRVGPFEARPADDLTVHAVVDGLAAG